MIITIIKELVISSTFLGPFVPHHKLRTATIDTKRRKKKNVDEYHSISRSSQCAV